MTIREKLIDSKAKIGVWGCGYIGFTTMVNFAKEGIYCVGYDVDKKVVDKIKVGQTHIPNLDYWIGYHLESLVKQMIVATIDADDMMSENIKVHLIAVPTEKGGDPWFEPLQEVMNKIAQRKKTDEPDLVMIESTLTPGMFNKVVLGTLEGNGWKIGKDILVGIAPRRDWFDSPEKNLKVLNRVIGGTTSETTETMRQVLSIVCDNLVLSDAETTELVKSVENSIFHLCCVYACQLANAYPDVDIDEVLRLASTHWRIPRYYPTVGTGGYCIPLSSKYVKDGASEPHYLTLTMEAIESDNKQPEEIANIMISKIDGGDIAILGLSYKRDLKVHVLSPSLKIISTLKEHNVGVKVYDPYYTAEEINKICGCEMLDYPNGLSKVDGIIVVPPHRVFSQTPKGTLLSNMRQGQVILDNEGAWMKWKQDFINNGIEYHRVGDKGWRSS